MSSSFIAKNNQEIFYDSIKDRQFQKKLIDMGMYNENYFTETREDLKGSSPFLCLSELSDIPINERVGKSFSQIIKGNIVPVYYGIRGKSVYVSYQKERWIRMLRFQYSLSKVWGFPFKDKIYIFGEEDNGIIIETNLEAKSIWDYIYLDYPIYGITIAHKNGGGAFVATKKSIYYDPLFMIRGLATKKEEMNLIFTKDKLLIKRIIFHEISNTLIIFTQKGAVGYITLNESMKPISSYIRRYPIGSEYCPMSDIYYNPRTDNFIFIDQGGKLYVSNGIDLLRNYNYKLFKVEKKPLYPKELKLSEFNGDFYVYDDRENFITSYDEEDINHLINKNLF